MDDNEEELLNKLFHKVKIEKSMKMNDPIYKQTIQKITGVKLPDEKAFYHQKFDLTDSISSHGKNQDYKIHLRHNGSKVFMIMVMDVKSDDVRHDYIGKIKDHSIFADHSLVST